MWLAPDAIATWEAVGVGKRGGQLQYSDLAIETALTLRLIFHLPVRLEFPILSLNPGLRHRCVAPGVWPPGATDAVRVQGTHLIPLSPGASTAITELQFGGAPEAAPPPPSGHGRAGTTSVPRASAPPDARTAGSAPAPLARPPATSRAAHVRPASRPITASPRGPLHRSPLSTPFPWPTPSEVALATRQITPIRRPGRRETSRRRHGPVAGHVSGTSPLMPAFHAVGCATPGGPYAVGRRTRRRGGAVRGAAVRAGWGRPPRGVACACCAR